MFSRSVLENCPKILCWEEGSKWKDLGTLTVSVPARYARDFDEQNLFGQLVEELGFVMRRVDDTEVEDALRNSRDEMERRVQERAIELEEANRKLKIYNSQLEELNKDLHNFAFIASHELSRSRGRTMIRNYPLSRFAISADPKRFLLPPLFRFRDREDRNRRQADHLFGHRPEDESAPACPAMGCHHDDIGLFSFRFSDYFIGRLP